MSLNRAEEETIATVLLQQATETRDLELSSHAVDFTYSKRACSRFYKYRLIGGNFDVLLHTENGEWAKGPAFYLFLEATRDVNNRNS